MLSLGMLSLDKSKRALIQKIDIRVRSKYSECSVWYAFIYVSGTGLDRVLPEIRTVIRNIRFLFPRLIKYRQVLVCSKLILFSCEFV